MRDIKAYADKGRDIIKEHPRKDVGSDELEALGRVYKDKGLFEVITQAYLFGLAVGAKN